MSLDLLGLFFLLLLQLLLSFSFLLSFLFPLPGSLLLLSLLSQLPLLLEPVFLIEDHIFKLLANTLMRLVLLPPDLDLTDHAGRRIFSHGDQRWPHFLDRLR